MLPTSCISDKSTHLQWRSVEAFDSLVAGIQGTFRVKSFLAI